MTNKTHRLSGISFCSPVERIKIMRIRKAVLADAKGIAKVHVNSWRSTYKGIIPEEVLQRMSYNEREARWMQMIPEYPVFVAETGEGEIIGFASGGKERSGNYPEFDGELYAIYLLQQCQGQGIGKALVKKIAESLKEMGSCSMLVLVLAENKSRYFYESLGAKLISTEQETIAGMKFSELVYGWKSIEQIFSE